MSDRQVLFTPLAQRQLANIRDYIADAAGLRVADRFVDGIIGYCEGFGAFAERGTRRDDLLPGLRTIGFRRRILIAFLVEQDNVVIEGVYYGGRDFEADYR